MAPMRVGGDVKPAAERSNRPPKPPMAASVPGRAVERTDALIWSTRELPAEMETPAEA